MRDQSTDRLHSCSSIGGSTRHAPCHRHGLIDLQPHHRQIRSNVFPRHILRENPHVPGADRIHCFPCEVLRIVQILIRFMHVVGSAHLRDKAQRMLIDVPLQRRQRHRLRPVHSHEHRGQVVIAVAADLPYPEVQVHFAVRACREFHFSPTCASRTKSSTASFSPRSCGSMPAARNASSAAADDP